MSLPNNQTLTVSAPTGTSLITASATGSVVGTLVSSLDDTWRFAEANNNLILGVGDDTNGKADVYVVEKWQSKKPINVGNGLYVSFEEDLYTKAEIQEMVYNKIEEEYPEKAIKLDLNKENLTIRKVSLPIEIKMKDN